MTEPRTQTLILPAVPAGWLEGLRRRALAVAVVGVGLSVVGAFVAPEHFFRAYLVAFLFWVGIPLGCLGIMMLSHMTGGGWGLVARRIFEAAQRTLPFMVLLFIPIVLGMGSLYEWTRPEAVQHSELLQHKAPYLNVPFFLGRTALYFALWGLFALLLNRWSLQQDRTGMPHLHRRMQAWSAVGLVFYFLAASFASFDWLMSLDAAWFSSLYGLHFVVGQGALAMCLLIFTARWLGRAEDLSRVYAPRHFDDYGKLLLTFVMLWVYMTYSQFVIIWSGNLPEEIGWYLHRQTPGYREISFVVFGLHFVLPFFMLMSKTLRRNRQRLALVAVFIFVARWLDLFWQAVPSMPIEGPLLHWLDPVVTLGMGGVWVALFAWNLQRRALLPQHDPHLQEALADA